MTFFSALDRICFFGQQSDFKSESQVILTLFNQHNLQRPESETMGEAGQPDQTGQPPPIVRRPTPIIAIIGLLVGIVGLFIFALPCGILAVILGIASYMREKTAIAWLVLILGIVDIVTWIFLIGTLA